MAGASAPIAGGWARRPRGGFHLPLTPKGLSNAMTAAPAPLWGLWGRMNEHPNYVFIPDPSSEGVRSYREPEVPHPLQLAFLEEAGERAYVEKLRALLSAGRLDEADALLSADLAGFGGRLARLSHAATCDAVTVEGWEDLLPILAEYEGPPITAITVGLTNDSDLVFEPGADHEPALVVALYSDDSYAFSRNPPDAVLAECLSEYPVFAGHDEDVEFYAVSAGLAPLNTALIQSKHRYFLRDGQGGVEGRAPGGYVEYVLATWLRALRFLQALRRAASIHGLPGGARLIAGTVGLHSDFACILAQGGGTAAARGCAPAPVATLTIRQWAPRPDPLAEEIETGSAIRRKIAEPRPGPVQASPVGRPGEAAVEPAPAPKQGFFARLFGRRRRRT